MQISFVDLGLLFLRISFGGMCLVVHVLLKFTQISDRSRGFVSLFGLGSRRTRVALTVMELVCCSAIIVGFATRLVVIPMIVLAVGLEFRLPANDPYRVRGVLLYPKETGRLYLLAWATLLLSGGGQYSLDALLR